MRRRQGVMKFEDSGSWNVLRDWGIDMSERVANVWRGELIESYHLGDVAVVDTKGNVVWSAGNPEKVTYARSSAKPLQALPLIETGAAEHYHMTDEELALTCASHNGETYHVERVFRLLERIGLPADALQCGIHPPYHQPSYETLMQSGDTLSALHNNCSGKHAGMLAMASHLGEDTGTYLQRDHGVQQIILDTISSICNYPKQKIQIGTDGCGVPVFGMPIRNLAQGFARLGSPQGQPQQRAQGLARIRNAMMAYPFAVAGTNRFCTDLMTAAKGKVVGKVGAEAVYGIGLPEHGLGIAVKIADGNSRALYPVVMGVLRQLNVLPETVFAELEKYYHPELRNHQGTLVGRIESVIQLSQHAVIN